MNKHREEANIALMQLAQWAKQAFTHSTDTNEIASKKIGDRVAAILINEAINKALLENRIKELEEAAILQSWKDNPDRMGR